ncbi:response regulator [Spirosoma agri]|uniref:Response regulator n=1 Tax=Spirosoma agri TaxID=1987381 RepID=A0A6M0IPK5_9BACT|nr:response regulator [Spirosoma agri]NEU70198.1 response regulator [Spirosoma agri]
MMNQTKANHILLVDDDEDDQFLVQQVIKQYSPDSSIDVLGDGEQLLDALEQSPRLPDLVLLDLNMPRMGGLEALGHIRANEAYEHLPIIILTTSDSSQDRQQAQRLQATDYLVKPGNTQQMNQLVLAIKRQWL